MGRWVEVSPHNIDHAPAAPGLYCVYVNRKLAYVGQSKNIRLRFQSHQFSPAIADGIWKGLRLIDLRLKVSVRVGSERDRLRAERRLIRRAQPILNAAHSTRKDGDKVRMAFANEMHLQYG